MLLREVFMIGQEENKDYVGKEEVEEHTTTF